MKHSTLLAAMMLAGVGFAQEKTDGPVFDFGGDVRMRYEGSNFMPDEKHGQKDHSDYMRLRTRVFGKATYGDVEGFVRVGNEFRYYRAQPKDKGKQRFPDVTYIDNLYLKFSDLWDFVDLKVGRQEMKFGASRIISDGTGGDGSRTNFFDAARMTFHFDKKRTLDAFVTYNTSDDWMPTLGHTHDAKSKGTQGYDYDLSGYNHDEFGAGLYYSDRSCAMLPWEVYYVFKAELDGSSGDNSSKVIPAGEDTFLTHTVGFRLLPRFTETLSGELEVAAQVGDDSLFAMMAYGGLTYAPKWSMKPKFTAAVQYMSGDEDGARGDSAWHSVFNRETGVGDLVAPMFNKYAYNNFLYPHLKLELVPVEHHKLSMQTGPMFAPVAESDGKGGEYGSFRGYYAQAKYSIALGKYFESSYTQDFAIAFLGEYMSKGSYFKDSAQNDALFARFEVTYKF